MNYFKRSIMYIAVIALTALTGASAFADDGGDDNWKWTIVPYAWMAGIDGDVTILGQKADVDIGFSDIWDNLDFAGMLQLEVQKRRFGLFAQPNYFKVSDKGDVQGISVDLTTEAWIVEFGGTYRLAEWSGRGEHPGSFDLLLGGRYWSLSNKINVAIPVLGVAENRKRDSNLIDPMVGLRLGTYLSKRVYFRLRGDAAGFDVSSNSSKISWQGIALIGYDFSKTVSIAGGYRVLTVDEEKDTGAPGNEIDLTFDGPVVGLAFQF
jgi:hypothetical protein